MNITLSLPDHYVERLRKATEETGMGTSELIRRALDGVWGIRQTFDELPYVTPEQVRQNISGSSANPPLKHRLETTSRTTVQPMFKGKMQKATEKAAQEVVVDRSDSQEYSDDPVF